MTDIRHYSDQELSLLFLNDEGLYKELIRAVRRDRFDDIEELCNEFFIYNEDQMEDLRETFHAELEEI
jgi:hypothetical protein